MERDPYLFCIRCYGRCPNDREYLHSPCCGTSLVTLECSKCKAPVQGTGTCEQCGLDQSAPPCPHCGKPVSTVPDNTNQGRWFGNAVWNKSWNDPERMARCVACGHVFSARVQIQSGHPHWKEPGKPPVSSTEICIDSGVSDGWLARDHLDLRPFVEVRVRRENEGSALGKEERIRLTPEEWHAVILLLDGPMSILLRQKPWWEDHT